MGEKICRICGVPKNINEYHKKKGTPDGYRNECKECCKDVQNKYRNTPDFKDKRKEYDKNRYNEKKDQILKRKKEYHQERKSDILVKKKVYRNDPKNKQRAVDYAQKYREENKDKLKEWRQNNKTKLAINQQNYRENNPHIEAWRNLLYATLRRLGTKKSGHTIDVLGYSALELKEYIEKLFKEGMTWENHGEWEIDHVIPVSNFPSDTPASIVCALSNLQPLWMSENRIKSNKIEF